MTAHAYKPKDGSQNYLHVDVSTELLKVGNRVTFKLHVDKAGDHEFTYMVSTSRIQKEHLHLLQKSQN